MIKFVAKLFSNKEAVIKKVTEKLEKEKEYNYDVMDEVPKKYISISANLSNVEIYLPRDEEFFQYSIDDFIREILPFSYTDTRYESGLYKMSIKGAKLTETQYYKLLKFIIDQEGFCVILDI